MTRDTLSKSEKSRDKPQLRPVSREARPAGKLWRAEAHTLVLSDAFLPHAGGSREYYNNIYQRLTKLGDRRVTLLTKKVAGWLDFDKTASGPAFRIRRWFKPLRSWKYGELPKGIWPLLHTFWHLGVNKVDSIHAGDLYPQGAIALLAKKLFGIPYAVYCHGEDITQTDRYRHQPRVRDAIYRCADAVIANSQFARQLLLRIGVTDARVHVITPGVDAFRFRPAAKNPQLVERYGLAGKTVIVTVARLVPRKGHRASLAAFAKICGGVPDAHYLIVGTGPEEERLKQQVAAAGIAHRVTFAGFVSGDQLPEIYNLADIMVMANRQEDNGDVEGFGIVFLEGNAAGKPVVGGKSGGAVEAIVDGVTGYLVDPDNVDEIADVLQRLLIDRELRERLGAAGLKRANEEFGWEVRALQLQRISRRIEGWEELPVNAELDEPEIDAAQMEAGCLCAGGAQAGKE